MTGTGEERRAAAIARYEAQLGWYERRADEDQQSYKVFQTLTLVFSVLTPVLIAIDGVSVGIEAGASAATAVCAGLLAIFNWRGNWIRFAHTAELLKSERAHYDTRTGTYSGLGDDRALDAFMCRIEETVRAETGSWGAELREARA